MNCPQCNTPIVAHNAIPFMGQVAIWLQCECGYETVVIVEASRFTLTFGDVENGANFYTLDGLHYRKTRPWHNDEQWNASLWSDVEMPMFTRFEDSTEVLGSL